MSLAARTTHSVRSTTELRIATEPELLMTSFKVCEPSTTPARREKAADSVSVEKSSVPCTAAEGELSMARGLCHTEEERVPVPELSPERATVPELSPERASVPVFSPERTSVPVFSPERALVPVIRPESPEAHKCPPSHLVLPPPPLPSGSPSACPQPTIYSVRAQWDYHPPVSLWSEYPLTPPTASKLRNPPLPIDPSAPPWLLAPASLPWLICPLAPPGSFILPAPPWSVVDPAVSLYYTPPVAPCLSVPPALSGSSIPSAPPLSLQLHCAIWIPVSALVTASSALPWSPGSYPSPWLIATAKSNSSIQWPRSIYIYIYIYIYTNRRN